MDWFRLYAELPSDPKIGTLDDANFRTFIELLCFACKAERAGNTELTQETVNWALRRNVSDAFQVLFQRNLIELNDAGEICITNWEKRQAKSDSSTERVRQFRERKRLENRASEGSSDGNGNAKQDETLPEQDGNGAEKNREEKNREEKKKTKPIRDDEPEGFAEAWAEYPRRAGGNSRKDAAKAYAARLKSGVTPDELVAGVRRYAAFVKASGREGTEYVKQAATFFGPSEHFREAWALPTAPTLNRQESLEARNREVARRALEEHRRAAEESGHA